jgi:carboxypeptidase Taq
MRRAGETTAFRLFREDSMNERMKELKSRLGEVYDLGMSTAVLRWDMSTYMPPGGADARGRQLALLSRLAHERQVDPAIGRLLDALEKDVAKLPMDSDDYCLVRAARRDFEQASRIPVSLVGEMESHFSHAYNVWTEARPANDFHRVRPLLEKTLDLSRRLARGAAPNSLPRSAGSRASSDRGWRGNSPHSSSPVAARTRRSGP